MKKLTRSMYDRKVSGVLGGIANYFGFDATLLRLIFIVLFVISGFMPLGLIYILAVIVMPEGD